jgi:glyoxylate reductase
VAMPKIFITRRTPQIAIELLNDAFGPESIDLYEQDQVIPRDELLHRVGGVDAILAILTETIDGELLDAAGPQLRIVANMAVGYDNIRVPEATQRGIPVTNTPGVLTETTADLTWALILATARRVGESEQFLRSGQWSSWSPTFMLGLDVHSKTLGIFGLGRIGKAVARRAQAFDMQVIYHSRTRLSAEEENQLNLRHVDLPELLATSDILSLHCPLTPETRHAFSAAQFAAMKPTAIFINTTRGPVVDEAALVEALQQGKIWGAGLDVFEQEPKVHPGLLQCKNTVLLPHIGSATEETRGKMATIAAQNIIARLNGQRPPNCINPEVLAATAPPAL